MEVDSRAMKTVTPELYDLAVIGAGPAGLAAAITAARTGVKVLLVERGKLPRHRVCGEFVSAEALSETLGVIDSAFPNIGSLMRAERLAMGGKVLLDAKVDQDLLSDPRTEQTS